MTNELIETKSFNGNTLLLKYRYARELLGDDILYTKIHENVLLEIENELEKTDVSFENCDHTRKQLAGDLQNEYFLSVSNHPFLFTTIKQSILNALSETSRIGIEDIFINSMWINFQKENEHNPIHIHMGCLSFVLYLQLPENLEQELKEQSENSMSASRGLIEFMSTYTNNSIKLLPQRGDLLTFNSEHRHQVYPFYSKGSRVTIAGNISDFVHNDIK